MGFKAWNINDLNCSLNAVPLDSAGGYGDDEVMTFSPEGDWFDDVIGADGEVTRFVTNEGRATIMLRYMITSGGNDRLMALHLADKLAPNGAGAGVFKANDKNGRLVVLAERAWIAGMPKEVKIGKKPTIVEWKIRIADARAVFIGGR